MFCYFLISDVPTKLREEFVTKDAAAVLKIGALKDYIQGHGVRFVNE